MEKRRYLISFLFVLFVFISLNTLAMTPYDNYNYNFWKEVVPAPAAYVPNSVIDRETLGLEDELDNPQDIFITEQNIIYLADTGNNRILIINKDGELINIIDSFVNQGEEDAFNRPYGLYVTKDGSVYIADRGNNRVIVLNQEYELMQELSISSSEESDVLSEDFNFRPRKVSVDPYGRIFVISAGVYDGIMEFDTDGEFEGFIGAPRVNPSLADVFWRLIGTKEQQERMELFLPVEHSNFDIDNYGFIYASVTGDSANMNEKLRRLNQAGEDILSRLGNTQPIGDYIFSMEEPLSTFIDVSVRDNNIFSVLDRSRGGVFTYDIRGNLLYVFGGLGNRIGLFTTPVAIDNMDDKMLVLDSAKGRLTIFNPTPYQSAIHNAIEHYDNGRYDIAAESWENVLEFNANKELAYSEIGRALFLKGEYEEAMEYSKLGNNRIDYSEAFKNYRSQVIEKYFFVIVLIIALLIILIFYKTSRKNSSRHKFISETATSLTADDLENDNISQKIKGLLKELKYSLHIVFHPFDGFWDLKHEKRGSINAAMLILFLVSATYIFIRQYTGFIFNYSNVQYLNIFSEAFSILFPFFLWCIVNWSLTTLMNGKGNFIDIVTASAYALTPIVIVNIPLTIVSNFLTMDEGAFYYFFLAVSVIWALSLLFVASMVTHQYDLKKNVIVSILIIIGIGISLFIGLVFINIIYELRDFFRDVYAELIFRL